MLQLFQSSTPYGQPLPDKDSRLASEALEQMPVVTMLCDPIDHRVTFANRVARETAACIADDLGIAADELCGTSVDIFHPRPGPCRGSWSSRKNCPIARSSPWARNRSD